jgi:hypothetical protein
MAYSDQEKARRASEAERLLNEPLLKEALGDMEQHAIEMLLSVDSNNPNPDLARTEWSLYVNAIRQFKRTLDATIREGHRVAARQDRVV